MDVLSNKEYKTYDRVSRYSAFPTYYNSLYDKYVYGTTTHLSGDTDYTLYKVQRGDTYDSIALAQYNNPTYFWIICNFNHIIDPFQNPPEGVYLKIPSISTIEFL